MWGGASGIRGSCEAPRRAKEPVRLEGPPAIEKEGNDCPKARDFSKSSIGGTHSEMVLHPFGAARQRRTLQPSTAPAAPLAATPTATPTAHRIRRGHSWPRRIDLVATFRSAWAL